MQQDVLICAFMQKGICVATLAVVFGEDVQFVVELGMLAGALHGRLNDQFSVLNDGALLCIMVSRQLHHM
jgi:hypothetical protein